MSEAHAPAAAPPSGDVLRKVLIVALLVGGVVVLDRFASPRTDFDPTGMLALGFVILASYTFGQLLEAARLPAITGYMLAGVLLGPSVASMLPDALRVGPFERGILDTEVVGQLRLLDTLAISLIALTAGGELQIEALRRSARALAGSIAGVVAIGLPIIVGFLYLAGGPLGLLSFPGIDPSGPQFLAFCAMIAVVVLATSPAATIAIVTSTGAKGTSTQFVMATVIFVDVLMATLFSVVAAMAGSAGSHGDEAIAATLAAHLGGSLLAGGVVGLLTILYLRYVNTELMLFLVGLVYTVAYAVAALGLDPILVFIAAGFTVSNASRLGEPLIHAVEQLSLPTYVVFFTLAGAGLDLRVLAGMAAPALIVVMLRIAVFWAGMTAGGRIVGVDPLVARWGWMGLVSQAGVALGLAALLGSTNGEAGQLAKTLLISVIGINQLLGPVLLKIGLGLMGELPGSAPKAAGTPAPAIVRRHTETEPLTEELVRTGENPWGPAPGSGGVHLDQTVRELEAALQEVVAGFKAPLEAERAEADEWLNAMRHEFLRLHRLASERADRREPVAAELRKSQQAMARVWRRFVLERAAKLQGDDPRPAALVSQVDALVETVPERMTAPWPEAAFVSHRGDRPWVRAQRYLLRASRWARGLAGRSMPLRELRLRELARYHLSGEAPAQLERVGASLVNQEVALAGRVRALFQEIVAGWDSAAGDTPEAAEERLLHIRRAVDEAFARGRNDIQAQLDHTLTRTARVIGGATMRLKGDLRRAGTPDLAAYRRRFGRVYRARTRGLERLGPGLRDARVAAAAHWQVLALELELFRLESGIQDAVGTHGADIARMLETCGAAQLALVDGALDTALASLEHDLGSERSGEDMAEALRGAIATLEPVVEVAAAASDRCRIRLADEQALGGLMDALLRAASELGESYLVPSEAPVFDEWVLPKAPTRVEVPFRAVATNYIEMSVTRDLVALSRKLADEVAKLAHALEELDRLIGFNLELANAELDRFAADPVPTPTRDLVREMLIGPLRRSRQRLAQLSGEVNAWPERARSGVRKAVLDDLEALRRQVMEGRVSELRMRLLRETGRRRVAEAGGIADAMARVDAVADRWIRRGIGEDRLALARVKLGLPDDPLDPEAFRAPVPTVELPVVYRRLFSGQAIESGGMVVGRADDIARARRLLDSGPLRAVAVVGEQGVGKGAVVRAVARHFEGGVTRFAPTEPVTVEEVDRWFTAAEPGRLYVIEGVRWLFVDRPGGFAPLRRFVEGVVDEGGRSAWLITAHATIWEHARQFAPLEKAFPAIMRLGALTPDELGSAILARHALSGFGAVFEPEEDLAWRARFWLSRQADRDERAREAWFRSLHDATGGLVHDALRLWVAAIRSVDEESGVVRLGPVPRPPLAGLRRLPDDVLLTLRQTMRQGWIDVDLYAAAFRSEPTASRAQLARLVHWGLLDASSGRLKLAAHLEGPLRRTLVDLGWEAA